MRQELPRQLLLVHHLPSHHSVNRVSHDPLLLDQTNPKIDRVVVVDDER